MINSEIQSENNVELNEQEAIGAPENIESSEEVKSEIIQEVENSSTEFEEGDLEISKIESEAESISSEEVDLVKSELNIDEEVKTLNDEAKILKHETEQQIEWASLGEDHKFDKNNFYRIVNEKGYADYLETDVVRSSPEGDKPKTVGSIEIGGRPTAFPSFSKGSPDLEMYSEKGADNFILESDQEMYRRGDVNPVTNNTIRGRHYAHRPIDLKTGEVINELDSSAIKDVYKKDKLGDLYRQIKKDRNSTEN